MNYNNDTQNRLILGTGNYLVSATINALIFKKIDKTIEIAEIFDNVNYSDKYNIVDIITIPFHNYSEIQQMKKLLVDAYEHNIFEYKNITFDFSNYNRKSVDCILDQLNWIEHFITKAQVI